MDREKLQCLCAVISIWTKMSEECLRDFVSILLGTDSTALKEKRRFNILQGVSNKMSDECSLSSRCHQHYVEN